MTCEMDRQWSVNMETSNAWGEYVDMFRFLLWDCKGNVFELKAIKDAVDFFLFLRRRDREETNARRAHRILRL